MKRLNPFFICSIFLLFIVLLVEVIALKKTNGHFSYPLDDTFIHMAVAKNMALYQTWGVSKFEFVSTSSSPLFTVLLTISFLIVGVKIWVPFIISLAGGILTVYALSRELGKNSLLSDKQKILTIIFSLVMSVVPLLSLLGMEHTLQIAFSLFFIHLAATSLVNSRQGKPIPVVQLAIIGALMVATRYENIFIVFIVCGLFFLQKKFIQSITIGLICILPVVLFGIYFYSKGGFPIPNSVLIKGNQRYTTFLPGYDAISSLAGSLGGLLIIACILGYNKVKNSLYDRDFFLLIIFILSVLFHSLFGKFGWYFRYEAYLIVFGVFTLTRLFFEQFDFKNWKSPATLIIGSFFLLLCSNLFFRVLNAAYRSSGAIHNIYDQQYQMGEFVREYYNGQTIAVNDVGAVSYFADVKPIDIIGLSSNEVTKARRAGKYGPEFIQQLIQAEDAKVIMVFESWFDKSLVEKWKKVATWKIPYNVICGDDEVSFFALNEKDAEILKQNLLKYEHEKLPKENKVIYFR